MNYEQMIKKTNKIRRARAWKQAKSELDYRIVTLVTLVLLQALTMFTLNIYPYLGVS